MPHYNMPMIWRLHKETAGSGALGDLGAHIIDLAHYLVGDISSVSAMTRTFITERPWDDGTMGTVDVDDAFVSTVEFENGAIGTLEATRFAAGRKNANCFEINGEKGSIRFDLERFNELEVFWVDDEPKETRGFHQRARLRALPSLVGELVAPGAHDRLGAHLRPRDHPSARLHRQRPRGRTPRRRLQRRLPRRRRLRRHS